MHTMVNKQQGIGGLVHGGSMVKQTNNRKRSESPERLDRSDAYNEAFTAWKEGKEYGDMDVAIKQLKLLLQAEVIVPRPDPEFTQELESALRDKVKPKIGDRVVLISDVERYPSFLVKAGKCGTVSDVLRTGKNQLVDGNYAVKMDEYVEGAEEWDNQIIWGDDIYDAAQFYLETQPMKAQEWIWSKEWGEEWKPPQEILDLLDRGVIADCSWHNDIAPSFCPVWDDGSKVRIWVDHPVPEKRESTGENQFFVTWSHTGEQDDTITMVRTDLIEDALTVFSGIGRYDKATPGYFIRDEKTVEFDHCEKVTEHYWICIHDGIRESVYAPTIKLGETPPPQPVPDPIDLRTLPLHQAALVAMDQAILACRVAHRLAYLADESTEVDKANEWGFGIDFQEDPLRQIRDVMNLPTLLMKTETKLGNTQFITINKS